MPGVGLTMPGVDITIPVVDPYSASVASVHYQWWIYTMPGIDLYNISAWRIYTMPGVDLHNASGESIQWYVLVIIKICFDQSKLPPFWAVETCAAKFNDYHEISMGVMLRNIKTGYFYWKNIPLMDKLLMYCCNRRYAVVGDLSLGDDSSVRQVPWLLSEQVNWNVQRAVAVPSEIQIFL